MNEKQGDELIYLLKEILTKLNDIQENSIESRGIVENISFKLDSKTIL